VGGRTDLGGGFGEERHLVADGDATVAAPVHGKEHLVVAQKRLHEAEVLLDRHDDAVDFGRPTTAAPAAATAAAAAATAAAGGLMLPLLLLVLPPGRTAGDDCCCGDRAATRGRFCRRG